MCKADEKVKSSGRDRPTRQIRPPGKYRPTWPDRHLDPHRHLNERRTRPQTGRRGGFEPNGAPRRSGTATTRCCQNQRLIRTPSAGVSVGSGHQLMSTYRQAKPPTALDTPIRSDRTLVRCLNGEGPDAHTRQSKPSRFSMKGFFDGPPRQHLHR